jgi:hypothetical protein
VRTLFFLLVWFAPSSSAAQQSAVLQLDRLNDPASLEQRIRSQLEARGAGGIAIANGQVRQGGLRIASGERVNGPLLVLGDAELNGEVSGNLVVLDGDLALRPGGMVRGSALVLGGRVQELGGKVTGEIRAVPSRSAPAVQERPTGPLTRLAGLAGVLIALGLTGFGLVTLARPRLEVVSDTVARSFFRSFLIGVLAQVIALPTAGLVVLGLVLSIVGILLLPFVALVVPLLLLTAVLVGFLAAMHAVGEARVRRRMAAGELAGSPNSYRYLLLGLAALGLVWLAWIVFGWVPVAGALVFLVALVTTWVAATAGLGAFLLSRAGLRGEAAGRFLPQEAMTDEYLWATPRYGVSAVKRPKR